MLYGAARTSRLHRFGRVLLGMSRHQLEHAGRTECATSALLMALDYGRVLNQEELLTEALDIVRELNKIIPDELFSAIKSYIESRGWESSHLMMFEDDGTPIYPSYEWDVLTSWDLIPLYPS